MSEVRGQRVHLEDALPSLRRPGRQANEYYRGRDAAARLSRWVENSYRADGPLLGLRDFLCGRLTSDYQSEGARINDT